MHIEVNGARLQATEVFDTYWYFAAERQKVFNSRYRKSNALPTNDEVLNTYRFTNSYRALDRVSQYLISEVQRNPKARDDPRNAAFRTLLFKVFNKIDTWNWLEEKIGLIDINSFNFEKATKLLGERRLGGVTIYSAAYIMPSPKMGKVGKHANHLALLKSIFETSKADNILKAIDLEDLYNQILTIPGFGRFLAFQYAIDLNYTDFFKFDEESFVVAGPGAIDGISKCFRNYQEFSAEEIIQAVYLAQIEAFQILNIEFNGIPGRKLQPIDCQNLFCEISKYARVAHPDYPGVSSRTRIKQKYKKNEKPLMKLRFPDFWNIDENRLHSAGTQQ